MAVSLKDLSKWLKEEVDFLIENEDYVGGWLQLGNGLAATVLWEPGFGLEERDDVIQSKENPDYALCAGILVYNPHDTPDGWHPLFDKEGNVVTETTSFNKDRIDSIAEWILNDFEKVKNVDYDKDGVIQDEIEESHHECEVDTHEETHDEKKVTESVGDSFHNSEYKDIIAEHFDHDWDFEFLDVVADIIDRIEDFDDDGAIYDAVDSGLIYTSDQWAVIEHYCSPDNANLNDAIEYLYNDLDAIVQEIKDSKSE